jgi:hypothetical protein
MASPYFYRLPMTAGKNETLNSSKHSDPALLPQALLLPTAQAKRLQPKDLGSYPLIAKEHQ